MHDAIRACGEAGILQGYFGRRVPDLEFHRMSARNVRPVGIALGFSDQELARFEAASTDPTLTLAGSTIVAAWGRKPV